MYIKEYDLPAKKENLCSFLYQLKMSLGLKMLFSRGSNLTTTNVCLSVSQQTLKSIIP